VKCMNKVDLGSFEIAQIALNDVFGESKYLIEPSVSYFGDVIAANLSVDINTSFDIQPQQINTVQLN